MSLVVLPQDALMPWVSVGHRCVTAAMAEAPRPNTCPKCQTEVVGGWDFAGIFCMFFFLWCSYLPSSNQTWFAGKPTIYS